MKTDVQYVCSSELSCQKFVSLPRILLREYLQYFFPLTPSFFRAASRKLEGTLLSLATLLVLVALEALRNALYKFKTYLLTYLLSP